MLREGRRELADRRRLPGAVHADDEQHRRRVLHVQHGRLAEEQRDLLGQRRAQLADVATRFEPAHELGRRGHADVGLQQRFLQPFPGEVVAGIERGDGELLGERAPRLRQRVAQARKEARPLRLRLGRGLLFAK